MTLKAYNSNDRKKSSLLAEFVTTFNLMLSNHGTFFMHSTLAGWRTKLCFSRQKLWRFTKKILDSKGSENSLLLLALAKKRLHVFVSQLGAWVSLSCSSSWAQFSKEKSGQNRKWGENLQQLFRNWIIVFINTPHKQDYHYVTKT